MDTEQKIAKKALSVMSAKSKKEGHMQERLIIIQKINSINTNKYCSDVINFREEIIEKILNG